MENDKARRLSDEYMLMEKIGSGSFGDVYTAEQLRTGLIVAAKVEIKTQPIRIINEYNIYLDLNSKNIFGVPRLLDFIETPKYNFMFLQLLGENLQELLENTKKKKFNLSTVATLGHEMMFLLESLHGENYIHRDIKPNNFLMGRNSEVNKLYIMDFGLSKKYIVDNKHISFKSGRSLIGTARYASINMHHGIEPTRRDDLESVGYMLVYFLKGRLPWQGLKRNKKVPHVDQIGEKKMCTSIKELCGDLPDCFANYIVYCRNLGFDDRPDYEYLRKLFYDFCKSNDIVMGYEW